MTVASIADATDEIAGLFVAAWPHTVEWPNMDFARPGQDATWARFALAFNDGGQSTLANALGGVRFAKSGFLIISVFTPLGVGLKTAYAAAELAVGAYEGKKTPSDVWFRDVRVNDDGQGQGGDKAWWQTTVTARFDFEQLK